MKKFQRIGALALACAFSLNATAFAALDDTGYTDVDAGAWYADAVSYVTDNGLMGGTSSTAFSPEDAMTRAMLATVLYRAADTPAVTGTDDFTDTADGTWYADAVLWASQQGLVTGYGDGTFGTDDPVSREQIAAILWRYAGSPQAQDAQAFSDESTISAYAADAVDWARANGIVNGKENNTFDPQGNATRAEVATILRNYLTMGAPEQPSTPDTEETNALVVYFSATGNTEAAAGYIADALGADTFEITAAEPYTADDLNWNDPESRVVYEYESPDARDVALVTDTPENWEDYDTVFIGYPIWWGVAAWPVSSFVAANDFTDKTVIPFCTSSSSGLGESGTLLEQAAGTGEWLDGQRFRSSASEAEVADWVTGLGL
nr:flavodoxin [uncultured Agathobaculum sp.]